jgi:LuxR family transcriptional regulator, maltose regulon positive regulatory protein
MTDQDQTLLRTKLRPPRLTSGLLQRTRLTDLFNREIERPLLLVCAPAGFGKTTLVCSWLEQMAAGQDGKTTSRPFAWLSLDGNDSDLRLFLRYFIAAIRTIFDDACPETLALLQAGPQLPQSVLFATLSNDLEELPGEAILVLDDYHTIHNAEVHKLLGELVRHASDWLHLVLISRIDPPLPLAGLLVKGKLGRFRTQDLRFTPEETAAYLRQSQLSLLSKDALPIIEERLEGWPAGLRLVALSLRSAGSQESVLTALSSDNTNITRYLVDEVLNQQPPAIHSFLLKTSILDRFCASLCEAVYGEHDAAWSAHTCLDWIERSELFVISLDSSGEWYRYHHLFQEALYKRLSADRAPDQLKDLHRLASFWFEEHGLIDEALQHALAAGDLDLAARQMSAGMRDTVNREDLPTLERWLRLMPEEMIQRRPELLMLRVWFLELIWRLDLQAVVLQQVEALLDSGGGSASLSADDLQILRAQILLPKAQLAFFTNQISQAMELCRQVLAILPASWTFVRGAAMLYLGLSMQSDGQLQAAERMLLNEYASCTDKSDIYPLVVLQSLGHIYLWTGQLERARQIASTLIQGATHSGIAIMKHWGDYFLAMACFHSSELDAAAYSFTEIIMNRYIATGATYHDAVAGLTLIHQAKGETSEAWKLVESLSQYDLEQSGSEDERTRSLRARLMLLQGDLEGAGLWVDTLSGPPPDMALLWLEEPQVTRARILVARGSETDLQSALQILEFLEDIAGRTHNTSHKIEVLALRALALNAQGQTRQAGVDLKQALDLAKPGRLIRVFIDLGRPMQEMLLRLDGEGYSVEWIRRLLAQFSQEHKNLRGSESPANLTLVEPLTPRELETLILLREPLSFKEIALKLNISYATVKRHTINIYAKLGVNQRWFAVLKAEELGILPPR